MNDTARPAIAAKAPSALALAAWLDEGKRGVAEVRTAAGACRLQLADGGLRLVSGDPLDRGGAAVPWAEVEPLIGLLAAATVEDVRFTPSVAAAPQGRALPTAKLLMETAVRGRDRSQLWSQIGGRNVVLRMAGESPLSDEALTGLDGTRQSLLARFVKMRRVADFVSDDAEGLETLRDLARLHLVGLLTAAADDGGSARTALSDHSRDLFVRRIARELERKPLRVNTDDHRNQVVELMRNLGVWNHYELLRVGRHQDEQAIHQAYVEMASLAHPSHAEKLHLEGKSAALDLLFEAVTEAYLVLSHPDRRRDYDRDLGADAGAPASAERRREKASVAREMYQRARRMAMEDDAQSVLGLMQQAVQLDPQAEYYKLLGDIQRRNPLWKAGALASYRDAVRCRPDDPDLRLAFARALQDSGERVQAGIQYRAALELRPHDEKLKAALDDFEDAGRVGKKKKKKEKEKGVAVEEEDDGKAKKGGKAEKDDDGGLFPTFRKLFRRGKTDKG